MRSFSRLYSVCLLLGVFFTCNLLEFADAKNGRKKHEAKNGKYAKGAHDNIILALEDATSTLPRINQAYFGDLDEDSNIVGGAKASLDYHLTQEVRVRAVLETFREKKRGRLPTLDQDRFERLVSQELGPQDYRRWQKHTMAMKKLKEHDMCAPIWNQATYTYYVCCLFRLGHESNICTFPESPCVEMNL